MNLALCRRGGSGHSSDAGTTLPFGDKRALLSSSRSKLNHTSVNEQQEEEEEEEEERRVPCTWSVGRSRSWQWSIYFRRRRGKKYVMLLAAAAADDAACAVCPPDLGKSENSTELTDGRTD